MVVVLKVSYVVVKFDMARVNVLAKVIVVYESRW